MHALQNIVLLMHLKIRNLHHQTAVINIRLIGNETITMLRCDSLARFRYRGDEEPKYPECKPSAEGKSYKTPNHLGLKDHRRGHNDHLEAK